MPPKRTPRGEDEKFPSVRPKQYNKRLKLRLDDVSTSLNTVQPIDTMINGSEDPNVSTAEELSDFFQERVINNQCQNDHLKTPMCTQHSHHERDDDEQEFGGSIENENATCTSSKKTLQTSDFEHKIECLLAEITANHCVTEDEEQPNEEETICDQQDCDSDTETEDQCSSEGNEDNVNTSIGEQPIYRGHAMSISVSLLLILLYTVTHGISGSQLNDLLTLIGLHCMEVHPGLKSLFHFKQHFAGIKSPLVRHYYCVFCLTCVNEGEEVCKNMFCGKNIKDAKAKSYFLEVPIETQLCNLFNRPDFTKLIQHRFTRKKTKADNIEDIYDGEIYKSMSENGGVLSDMYPHNISFTLNTDGVPLFKSSKFSIWPVYLMINELPFKVRKQSENMIFCGLWFGDSKPFMGTFSRPIHDSLKKLEEDGINVIVNGNSVTCRAFLICITADLPAKSILMNMNQFNGQYSCPKCCEKGETFRTPGGGSVHIFPVNKDNPLGQERLTINCLKSAIEAVDTKKTVNGIKGPSFLMTLKSFDFVKGVGIDYMHGALLGVTKLMMKLWFSSGLSKEDFSISQHAEVIDKCLLDIKPPSFITRIPRSIITHIKYWKASELRSWLFFYSLPILSDILPESYFLHYASFVEAMFLLCGSSISAESIFKCQRLLLYFVMTFSSLYGDRYLTLNIHQLLHFPECVRRLGPLWAYSCFHFETVNGNLTKLFHGTQNVELQILSSVNVIQLLPSLIATAPSQYKSVIHKLYPGKLSKHVTSFHLQFLGKGYDKRLSDETMQQLLKLIDYEVPNMTFYNRVLLRGELYHSKDYTRVAKRNNYTVKYFCQESKLMKYGYIQYFGSHIGLVNEKSFAFVFPAETKSIMNNLKTSNELAIAVPHIQTARPSTKTNVVEINNIIGVCVNILVSTSNTEISFICESPNSVETD